MKTLKINSGIVAALFAVTALLAGSAFSPAQVKNVDVMYEFTSDQLSNARVSSAYSEITGAGPSCSGSNLPCIITVPEGQTLEQYLGSFNSDAAVRDAATATKN